MIPWDLQEAIYTRLSAFGGLTAIVSAVYDHNPQDATFPYLTIGDDDATPWDTKSEVGSDNVITLHAWSRYRGKKEVKDIQRQCFLALDRYALTISGVDVINVSFDSAESFLDEDGITRHGVQRFRVLIDEG